MPVAISFTVETDGRLSTGQTLKAAIEMGGCCGTDHRHIEQVALACRPLFRDPT